jgi:uncharacterized protein (TIGR02597 family)
MDPVGAVVVSCLGGPSDTRITLPFMHSPEFTGAADSVAGGVITLTGAGFTAGAFDEDAAHANYYVLAQSGADEGDIFDIVSNTADTVTVADSGALAAGDTVSVCKHWTVSEIAGNLSNPMFVDQTTMLFYDSAEPGINKAANPVYTYWTDEATYGTWYDPAYVVVDDYPIYPGESIIIRNNAGVGADVDVVFNGNVPMNHDRLVVYNNGSAQDNYVGMMCPVGQPTFDTGLGINDQDLILVPDNLSVGINKGAAIIYTYWTDHATYFTWYDPAYQDMNAVPLEPGWGYIYRSAGNATPVEEVAGTVPYMP